MINLLTVDSSGNGVTLSEIARRLGVSKATCYPMLEALTDAGFLSRHASRKTFHLGPALVAAGAAAAKRNPRREQASEAMMSLGDELDLTCWLVGVDGQHLRVIDLAWHSHKLNPILRVGERFSFQPPRGAALTAWADKRLVDQWLDRGEFSDEERASLVARLADVRRLGYCVELEFMPIEQLRGIVTRLANATTPADRARLVEQLSVQQPDPIASILVDPKPNTKYSVQSIDAPIFDGDGEVTMALGVINLPLLTRRRIRELGERVRAAADEVNRAC